MERQYQHLCAICELVEGTHTHPFNDDNDSEKLCQECFDDHFIKCDNCGDVDYFEDSILLQNGDIYCSHCGHNYTERCEDCHEYIPAGEGTSTLDAECVCSDCIEENYTQCYNCEVYTHDSAIIYSEYHDLWLCPDCHESLVEEQAILSYSDEPILRFNSTKEDDQECNERFYGIELEVEVDEDYDREGIAIEAKEVTSDIYIKHDGSLDYGFEIVSHPATYRYHMESGHWDTLLDFLREYGCTSHDAGTCGLHIHVSRKAFGANRDDQDENITKVIYLIERHWEYVKRFSRRTSEQLYEWARSYLQTEDYDDVLDRDCLCPKSLKRFITRKRYVAVNLTNSQTVEFRLFRGTLIARTFYATLQFVDHLVNLSTSYTEEELTLMTWKDIVDEIPEHYTFLKEYLEIRNLV